LLAGGTSVGRTDQEATEGEDDGNRCSDQAAEDSLA